MYSDQQIQIAIETYIHEGLPPAAEDQLFIEFLKNKDWYDYFIIELHLRAIGKRLSE